MKKIATVLSVDSRLDNPRRGYHVRLDPPYEELRYPFDDDNIMRSYEYVIVSVCHVVSIDRYESYIFPATAAGRYDDNDSSELNMSANNTTKWVELLASEGYTVVISPDFIDQVGGEKR